MDNSYQIIDENNWKRAMHCQVFRDSVEPAFCVTVELDITSFLEKVKKNQYSFTFAMVYATAKAANQVEEFRYRFLDGKVVLYDQINTAFTYLNKETELFKVVNVPMQPTLSEYVREAKRAAESQEAYFTGPLGNDVFQCSPMPWVSYTHISHTNSGTKENATPLFDWGKYFERDGKIFLPFSVQVHHSFVDGIHVGRFLDLLQEYLFHSDQYEREVLEDTVSEVSKDIAEIWVKNTNNELLLIQRHPSQPHALKWECPGGPFRLAESPVEAAQRQLFEQSGLSASQEELIYLGDVSQGDYHIYSYLYRMPDPNVILHLIPNESIEARYIDVDVVDHIEEEIISTVWSRFLFYAQKIKEL